MDSTSAISLGAPAGGASGSGVPSVRRSAACIVASGTLR
jgi:hypothetical protein